MDVDKDGFTNLEEFDRFLEKVAIVPRRYGLAPAGIANILVFQIAHKRFLDLVAHGLVSLLNGSLIMSTARSAKWQPRRLVSTRWRFALRRGTLVVLSVLWIIRSFEHASFCDFIFNCFVEVDRQCEGCIIYNRHDKFLTRAVAVPCHFGLTYECAGCVCVISLFLFLAVACMSGRCRLCKI